MSLERPIDRVLGAFPGAKRRQGYWSARCPSHDDRKASLSIREVADGRVTVKCFAGCSKDDVLSAVGLEWRELLPPTVSSRPRRREGTVKTERLAPTPPPADRARADERGKRSPVATIERLAESKRLPVSFLLEEGLRPRYGVEIPYFDVDGSVIGRRVRERVGESFRWHDGRPVAPYGLEALDAGANERRALGRSDRA